MEGQTIQEEGNKMKKLILSVFVFLVMFVFQGCYTILDLPDYYADNYETTVYVTNPEPTPPVQTTIFVGEPLVISQPPSVTTSNPEPVYKDRTNEISTTNSQSITRSESSNTTSRSNSNSSSNNSGRGNSQVRNSGNGRR